MRSERRNRYESEVEFGGMFELNVLVRIEWNTSEAGSDCNCTNQTVVATVHIVM